MRRFLVSLLVVALAGTIIGGLGVAWYYQRIKAPWPLADQCVATVAGKSVALDVDQAHHASIIAGLALRRGLVPRAATIGIATAYQESGIHNLDYGDRDSLGIFQQRPSQGWGTEEQVMDPYYATNKFYAALVRIDGWQTGDINDVAQAVQRSGHPNGYRRHVENARRVASSLTGETPASFSCRIANPPVANPAGFEEFASRTLPKSSTVSRDSEKVTITSKTTSDAWAAAHIAVANTGWFGVSRVTVADQSWTASRDSLAPWEGKRGSGKETVVYFDVAPSPGE